MHYTVALHYYASSKQMPQAIWRGGGGVSMCCGFSLWKVNSCGEVGDLGCGRVAQKL